MQGNHQLLTQSWGNLSCPSLFLPFLQGITREKEQVLKGQLFQEVPRPLGELRLSNQLAKAAQSCKSQQLERLGGRGHEPMHSRPSYTL